MLRAQALQLPGNHALPTALADWYGAIAAYSQATTVSTAHIYADNVYSLLKSGFSAKAETGETIWSDMIGIALLPSTQFQLYLIEFPTSGEENALAVLK